MRRLWILTLATTILCSAPGAYADSTAFNVTILNLQLNRDYPNLVFIKLSTPPTGKPACSNHFWDYTLPLATALDNKFYATLVAAHAARSSIDIGGLGVCNEFPLAESLRYVTLNN